MQRAIKAIIDYFSLSQNIFKVLILLLNILAKIIPDILHEIILKKGRKLKTDIKINFNQSISLIQIVS